MSKFLKFFIPSLLGMLLFIIPIPYNGSYSILVGILSDVFVKGLARYLPTILTGLIGVSALLSMASFKQAWVANYPFLQKNFQVSPFMALLRSISALICLFCLFEQGPTWLYANNTGGVMLRELLPPLCIVFFLASFLLALLVNFGLLEFFGVLCSNIMRPLFNLPGRAALDCLASWVGDGTIGALLTSKQYEMGHYNAREASIIGSTFSLVSISSCIVVINQVKLGHMFVPFYTTVVVCSIVCALIIPRIPPLSSKKNTYLTPPPLEEKKDTSMSTLSLALDMAMKRASTNSFVDFLKDGLNNLLEMWVGVLPVVMVMGTCALLMAAFTPVFAWMGAPFIPLLRMFAIPESAQASQSLAIGFTDMFLPAILATNIKSELTRFVVACVSVSQLIFMTETGSFLLTSKIPLNFVDLLLIFLLRTLITLPITAFMAHCFFF